MLFGKLERVDHGNVSQVSKIISNLNADIIFLSRRSNIGELAIIQSIIRRFLSINTRELYQDSGRDQYIEGLEYLDHLISRSIEECIAKKTKPRPK